MSNVTVPGRTSRGPHLWVRGDLSRGKKRTLRFLHRFKHYSSQNLTLFCETSLISHKQSTETEMLNYAVWVSEEKKQSHIYLIIKAKLYVYVKWMWKKDNISLCRRFQKERLRQKLAVWSHVWDHPRHGHRNKNWGMVCAVSFSKSILNCANKVKHAPSIYPRGVLARLSTLGLLVASSPVSCGAAGQLAESRWSVCPRHCGASGPLWGNRAGAHLSGIMGAQRKYTRRP